MEELVSLCKRRGFIFQSSVIYSGLQGIYDYGPLGVELKSNLKAAWWRSMVYERDDVEGLDAAILTNPLTLKYSGHEATFTDPLVDCRDCKARHRADHLTEQKCPACGSASVFAVDAVNEIVEMLKLTGAEADFADEIDTLAQAGHIAALLRY